MSNLYTFDVDMFDANRNFKTERYEAFGEDQQSAKHSIFVMLKNKGCVPLNFELVN